MSERLLYPLETLQKTAEKCKDDISVIKHNNNDFTIIVYNSFLNPSFYRGNLMACELFLKQQKRKLIVKNE